MFTLEQFSEYGASTPKAVFEKLEPLLRCKLKELELPEALFSNLKQVYLPLYYYLIEENISTRKPLTIGICGAQGSGKTTFTQLLHLVLETGYNLKVVSFSIDDFYLTLNERIHLSNTVHPLLLSRGVPGTHDTKLGIETLNRLKNYNRKESIAIPVFDKSTDDRKSPNYWNIFEDMPDVILFEGWCVGAKPQTLAELKTAVNNLEEQEDRDGRYRNYVNTCLENEYQQWFGMIDMLIMLKVPSFDKVFEWRLLQEEKLKKHIQTQQATNQIMDKNQVKYFVSHFERLTKHMLLEMPSRADIVFPIDDNHFISGVISNLKLP